MATKKVYGYKTGTRTTGVRPDVAYKELERIRLTYGGLRPDTIVDESEAEDAPLHPAFEWDDSAAGRSFRLIQARTLVRAVTVTSGKDAQRSVYVHVQRADGADGAYEPMDIVVTHPDRFAVALAELVRRLQSAEEAVEELRDLAAGGDEDRQARITIALQAFRVASEAVRALH
jgi:hypothetical protein